MPECNGGVAEGYPQAVASSEPPLPPPPGGPVYVYVPQQTDGQATAALVVGILSLFGIFCYGVPALVLGPIAIFLGLNARNRIRAAGGTVGGSGFAMAGWIMGVVATVLGAAYLFFFIAFFGFTFWMIATHPFPTPTPSG